MISISPCRQPQQIHAITEDPTELVTKCYNVCSSDRDIQRTQVAISLKASPMSAWEQKEAFPIIERIIVSECSPDNQYVMHERIAAKLLTDAEGIRLIDKAIDAGSSASSAEIASNMVAWFSQKFTEGQLECRDRYQRVRIEDQYAYRPSKPN